MTKYFLLGLLSKDWIRRYFFQIYIIIEVTLFQSLHLRCKMRDKKFFFIIDASFPTLHLVHLKSSLSLTKFLCLDQLVRGFKLHVYFLTIFLN